MTVPKLGRIDLNILRILQKDGRISYTDLAKQVGLSVTPCIERVKRLERENYILNYGARVSAQKLNQSLVVFVQIRLNHTSQKKFRGIQTFCNGFRKCTKLFFSIGQL